MVRWYEILKESSNNLTDLARDTVLDILTPLMSMGVSSITLPQVIDQLGTVPELQGMDITNDFIMDIFKDLHGFTIEPNEQGVMSIKIDDNSKTRQVSKVNADKEDAKINQAAMNTIKKDLGK